LKHRKFGNNISMVTWLILKTCAINSDSFPHKPQFRNRTQVGLNDYSLKHRKCGNNINMPTWLFYKTEKI
jgi:hypothetical protein